MATSGHIRLFKLTLATLRLCIGTFRSVPTQPQFSTAFNSALTERKQPGQTWLCLLLWFCSIILFPLLVVTYWSFIKTKWVRFQPGSINCHPSRKPKSTIFFLLSLSTLLPFLRPYFHLLLFVLSFLPLFLPCSLLLSGEREESYRSLISSWESAVWGPSQCDFVVYSVSRHLRGRPSVCVESGRGDWIAWVASRRKIKEREKKKIKEKKRGRVIFHNKRNSNMVIWCP